MDYTTIGGSLFEITGSIIVVYVLRKQRHRTILGLAGPLLLIGFTLLGIAYGMISGIIALVPTGIAIMLIATFSYLALRADNAQPSASAKEPD